MALIGWDNTVARAETVLGVNAAAAGMGAENLRLGLGNAAAAWQTPAGTTSASVLLACNEAVPYRVICAARTNLTASALLRVRIGTAASYLASPAYDSGLVPADVGTGIGQAIHVLPSAVTAPVLLLDILDPSNPDGFLNIPLLWAGDAAAFNLGYASTESRVVRRQDVETRGGTVLPQPLSVARAWQITAPLLLDAQGAWWAPLEAAAAASRNILFIPRLAAGAPAREAIVGLLQGGPRGFVGGSGQLRSWSATITERL